MKNHEIGMAGEALACEYLISRGYSIVCRNYRSGHLETDIICENATHILFVEVKSRLCRGTPSRFGRPGAAVDASRALHAGIAPCGSPVLQCNRLHGAHLGAQPARGAGIRGMEFIASHHEAAE